MRPRARGAAKNETPYESVQTRRPRVDPSLSIHASLSSLDSSATSERDAIDEGRGRGRIDVRRERDDDARGVRDAGDGDDDAWEGDEGDDAIDIDRARGADDDVDARGTSWDKRDARGGRSRERRTVVSSWRRPRRRTRWIFAR